MCLAVPAQLIEQDGQVGIVDLHGNRLPVNTMMTPDAQTGDWILIHAGFAIERLDPGEARETWALLDDVQRAAASDSNAPDVHKTTPAARSRQGGRP
jgi:hydrogenase expression/formation protein HypC